MMRFIFISCGAVLWMLGTSPLLAPAYAQVLCGEHNAIAERLKADFSEAPSAIGLSHDGGMVEVYTSDTGTWTMTVTYTDGRTCMVSHGEAWESVPVRLAGPAI